MWPECGGWIKGHELATPETPDPDFGSRPENATNQEIALTICGAVISATWHRPQSLKSP
jgi:hypothetical protein